MKGLTEFQGVNHVAIHIPDEDGEPVCGGVREDGNELFGPHELAVTPIHTDVCPDCQEHVPTDDLANPRYRHAEAPP